MRTVAVKSPWNCFRSDMDQLEQLVEDLKRQVNGEYNRKLDSMRTEQNSCENELRRRDADVDTLESRARVLAQKVETCQSTCARQGHPCSLLRGQISEQDATVLLLKGELRTQADAMAALNLMVDYKQTALEKQRQEYERYV